MPPKKCRQKNFLLDRFCGTPLAKHEQKGYVKREPRLLLAGSNRGWHGAVSAPMHGYQTGYLFYDPDPPRMGRGQLLFSVRRRQEDKGHSDQQNQNKFPHG